MMHEISVMSSILEQVLKELDKHEVEKVEEVELVVGELTFLGYEQLMFAYEIMSRDTPLEGAELKIVTEKLEVECSSCGYSGATDYLEGEEYHMSIPVLHCPKCGGKVLIAKGKRCGVTSIKVVEK
jgi:hydrogenase nickel incorporation protein HypA/HybF